MPKTKRAKTQKRTSTGKPTRSTAGSRHTKNRHRATAEAKAPKDALAFLRAEHRQVLSWLDEMKRADNPYRREHLLDQVERALQTHTKLEEEVFYPAFRDVAQTKHDLQMYYEALEEHHAVDTILPEVKSVSAEGDVFPARAKVLKELVAHHAEEEEEEMFPRVRQLMPPADLRRLGAEMAARKRTLQQRASGPLGAVASLFTG